MSDTCIPPPNPPIGTEDVCAGRTLIGSQLQTYWCNSDCPTAFSTILNTTSDGKLGFNPANLPRVQDNMVSLFDTYQKTNIFTDSTVDPGYSPFQYTILRTCNDPRLLGICDKALAGTPEKKGLCSGKTRDQISSSKILADFCGCYAPPNPNYAPYTSVECDPLCHRASTIQLIDPATGKPKVCQNTVCVIDQVSISLTSTTTGGITFQQVCPGCQGDPCVCIVSGVSVAETLSQVGVGTNFSQLCGPNSVCLTTNPDGTTTQTPCKDSELPIPTFSSKIPIWIYVVVGIVILIAILFMFAAKYPIRTYTYPTILVEKDIPLPARSQSIYYR